MSDDKNYYQLPTGTVSGFTSPDLFQTSPIDQTGWSKDILRQFLLNLGEDNFPSADRLKELTDQIEAHLQNFANPHHVSLDQIITNVTKDIISKVIPGAPPTSPPFFSYDAVCPLPLNNIFPASYTATNFYRMVESGGFVDAGSEGEMIAVDSLHGEAGIPLFSTATNLVASTWTTAGSTPYNTTMAIVTPEVVNYPFPFYQVTETNVSGEHGVRIPVTQIANKLHGFCVFIKPVITTGWLIVRQGTDPNNYLKISIADRTCEVVGPNIVGNIFVYPNGVIRVVCGYISESTTNTAVHIVYQRLVDSTPSHVGQNGTKLFQLAYPLIMNGVVGGPIPINNAVALTTSSFQPLLNKVNAPTTLTNLMVTMSLTMYPLVSGATITDTVLLSFDKLTITRNATTVYVKYNGVTVFTSLILDGLNVFSVSYSPTTLKFKDLANNKQSMPGIYGTLATANVSVGPCGAYLRNISMYGAADLDMCLEYLTNG